MQVGTRVKSTVELQGANGELPKVPVGTYGTVTQCDVVVKFSLPSGGIVNYNVWLDEIAPVEVTPVSYYVTTLTTQMILDGNCKPTLIRCESAERALEFAKEQVAMGMDKYETTFSCLIVFSDGSISQQFYSVNDLEF